MNEALIYPYWNVKGKDAFDIQNTINALIYPYWNVKMIATMLSPFIKQALIYPYWNVNYARKRAWDVFK